MKNKTVLTLASGVALSASAILVACSGKQRTPAARAAEIPSAEVALVQRGNITHTLSLAGQFQPYQVIDVHPKVSGYMRRINVDIGDIVHQGQTLATLEVPELKAQLQGTQFQVAQSQQEITRAEHEVARAEAMHTALHAQNVRLQETSKAQPGLIAQQELDNAQSQDLSSEAQVDATKAALAAARQGAQVATSDNQRVQALHNYTNVVAPIDGVIIWRYADTGALIQGGTNSNNQDLPIVRLAQDGILRLRMPVPEADIRYVHVGDPVELRVDALGRSFTGKIVRFTRSVNFETRSMETEVDVNNRNLSIDPGMYANAQLPLARAVGVLTVPVEALVLKGQQETVYALDGNNRIRIRNVEVGVQGSHLAEITSGLHEGDRVIAGGQEKYLEDQEVVPHLVKEPTDDTFRESGGVIDLKADQNAGGQQ